MADRVTGGVDLAGRSSTCDDRVADVAKLTTRPVTAVLGAATRAVEPRRRAARADMCPCEHPMTPRMGRIG